jgi:hypothetical protein
MKNLTKALFWIAVLAQIGFMACRKDNLKEQTPQVPIPVNDTASYLVFSVSGVTANPQTLFALVSVEGQNAQPLLTNRKVKLNAANGFHRSDTIRLSKGNYKISKFLVVNNGDTAQYATPKTNSAKAPQVRHPLSMDFPLNQKGVNYASISVLKISDNDTPESFGYTSTDFGYEVMLKLKLSIKMTLGTVEYDSLGGKLKIIATKDQGNEQWVREIELQRGLNSVNVPENYSKYHFQVNQWNVPIQKEFSRSALQQGTAIVFEGARQPKMLKSEATWIETVGGLLPDTKTDYYYNSFNKLSETKFYQRKLQVSGLYLTWINTFHYEGNHLDTIKRFDADMQQRGTTALFYEGGRLSNGSVNSFDQDTYAAFEYGTTGSYETITGNYILSNGHTMEYKFRFKDGNKVSDEARTSTGGIEGGTYTYDSYINPKHQLGWDDIYLTNASKSNLTGQQKGYGGAFPSVIPYKYEYTYDADGYPTESYVSYKSGGNGEYLYRIKKVYTYQ